MMCELDPPGDSNDLMYRSLLFKRTAETGSLYQPTITDTPRASSGCIAEEVNRDIVHVNLVYFDGVVVSPCELEVGGKSHVQLGSLAALS